VSHIIGPTIVVTKEYNGVTNVITLCLVLSYLCIAVNREYIIVTILL